MKSSNYNRRNSVEVSGISNVVSDQNLEETVTGICKDSGIEIKSLDIEGFQRLPLGRNAINTSKRVIVKFVNRKHRKLCFRVKRTLSRKVRCLLAIRYVPIIGFYGESAKNYREKTGLTELSVLELSSW